MGKTSNAMLLQPLIFKQWHIGNDSGLIPFSHLEELGSWNEWKERQAEHRTSDAFNFVRRASPESSAIGQRMASEPMGALYQLLDKSSMLVCEFSGSQRLDHSIGACISAKPDIEHFSRIDGQYKNPQCIGKFKPSATERTKGQKKSSFQDQQSRIRTKHSVDRPKNSTRIHFVDNKWSVNSTAPPRRRCARVAGVASKT